MYIPHMCKQNRIASHCSTRSARKICDPNHTIHAHTGTHVHVIACVNWEPSRGYCYYFCHPETYIFARITNKSGLVLMMSTRKQYIIGCVIIHVSLFHTMNEPHLLHLATMHLGNPNSNRTRVYFFPTMKPPKWMSKYYFKQRGDNMIWGNF